MSLRKVTTDEMVEAEIARLHNGGIAIKRNEPLSQRKEEKNELHENEGTA